MSINWIGYAGTTVVILAYLPQIIHLIRERCSAGLSHKAYLMWAGASVLLLLYAVAIRDGVFIALQGYQLTAATLICFFCKKYEGQLCEEHDGDHVGKAREEVAWARQRPVDFFGTWLTWS